MDLIKIVIQIIIACAIYNVWIVRFGKATKWRGGSATNMKAEFEVYGIPNWLMMVVGFFKLLLATLLLAGILFPIVVAPAAIGMAFLMMGALSMHVKVGDPLMKSLPAFSVFSLCIILILLSLELIKLS